jgi:glycosyltransferase involved in cell wall biosynthesis
MRPRISILLPTFNNAATVHETLESVKWADEILVVDSFSTDTTLDLCKQYGARVIQHEYINSAKQKNWAVAQCENEWVLQIDSDEVLEPGTREEIERVLRPVESDVHAFRFPDYQIRLFRRDVGRWNEREVHAHLNVPGEIKTLTSNILHYGMPNLSKQLRNLDRYTRYEADELRKNGISFGWTRATVRPWFVFLKRYVWERGFLEGWRGFILCAYLAIYYFLTQAKLWELEELQLEQSPR